MTKPFKPTPKIPERIVGQHIINEQQYYWIKWQDIETPELIEREVAEQLYLLHVWEYSQDVIQSRLTDDFFDITNEILELLNQM